MKASLKHVIYLLLGVAIILIISSILLATNSSSEIPGQAFVRDCNKYTNGADAFCKCWYKYLRTKYTVDELKQHVIDTQDVSDAKAACLQK